MNFVDFVEKYQQEMAPEQMLAICLHPTSKIWHTING